MKYDSRQITIDNADLWPRYYFDLDRAKLEIAAWLSVYSQEVVEDWTDEIAIRDWRHEFLDSLSESI